ncbi:hypothetical protein GXW82_43640 [Streptacidiphilus sp. 4-A2]|nr:hypothetical protein [Streptacidiphilus sp. 4-A2]
MSENTDAIEALKSLIFSTAQELWDDKEALGKFLGVVRAAASPRWLTRSSR